MSTSPRPLPAPGELTWEQSAGRACVWCRRPLTSGVLRAGIVRDQLCRHNLDTEVWAGPCCVNTTR